MTEQTIKPSEFWQKRWKRDPDWILDAELEHAYRLLSEAPGDEDGEMFWHYYILQIYCEMDRRAAIASRYQASAPFNHREAVAALKRDADLLSVIGVRYPSVVGRANPWAHGRVSISCPFHQDDSPSLSVYTDQQTWWCFSCQQGGDAIDFVQRSDGLRFWPAVEKLAAEFGIPIQKTAATMTIRTLD